MTRLRKMMLEELQRRNYSAITTRNYLRVVTEFAKHFGFVLGDPTAAQLPFMEGSGAARFSQQAEQQTVGDAHTVPVMTGEQAAERPGDGVVAVLLPGPERIEAAQRAVGGGANGVLGWFGKDNLASAGLRVRQGFGVIRFEEDHAPSVAPDESGTTVGTFPFDAIATVLGDGGLMGGLTFPHPSSDVPSGGIGGIPSGSPEQQPVPAGALIQRRVVTIPTLRKLQAVVQVLKLAAEQDGHADRKSVV